jgi:hypothetical protein
MDVLYPRCCGIDVHKRNVLASAIVQGPEGQPSKTIHTFGTMNDELLELADWLAAEESHTSRLRPQESIGSHSGICLKGISSSCWPICSTSRRYLGEKPT